MPKKSSSTNPKPPSNAREVQIDGPLRAVVSALIAQDVAMLREDLEIIQARIDRERAQADDLNRRLDRIMQENATI